MKDKNKKSSAGLEENGQHEPDISTTANELKAPQVNSNHAPGPSKTVAEEKYLRLLADFDNLRKRTIRERSELYQRASSEIIADLLPVLDHLEMALASACEHKVEGAVIDGFKLVAEQLLGVMRKAGLNPIEVEKNAFDPMIHEAISHLPSDTVPENFIITQVRKGYKLGDRMIRAARVVVSSGKPRQAAEQTATEPSTVESSESDSETARKEN